MTNIMATAGVGYDREITELENPLAHMRSSLWQHIF